MSWLWPGPVIYIVFQRKVQSVASELDRSGIPALRIDAGAQRNGEQLYVNRPDMPPSRPDRPWWVNFFAPDTDPAYIISTKPVPGYDLAIASWQRALLGVAVTRNGSPARPPS